MAASRPAAVLPLLLLLMLLLWGGQATGDTWGLPHIISSMMMGVHLDEEVHVARIRYSSRGDELQLVLDFTDRVLTISRIPSTISGIANPSSHPRLWSPSFSSTDGGSDIVHLGNGQHRVPVRFDPDAAARQGCAFCNGVLGVGAQSPLWLIWPRATFSAGTVVLAPNTRSPVADGQDHPRIACLPADNNLCTARGEVFGDTYDIRFSFTTPYTFVPFPVFNQYVGSRSVGNTPLRKWPDFVIRFESADAPADPRTPTLRVSPASLIGASHVADVRTLLLRPNPNALVNDTIVLGRSVWRSLMFRRFFDTGLAIVQTYDSTKRFPIWAQILGLVIVVVAFRWFSTRDALAFETPGYFADQGPSAGDGEYVLLAGDPKAMAEVQRANAARFPSEWGVYPDRMVIEILSIPAGIAALYLQPMRSTMIISIGFYVFLSIMVYASVLWIIVEWLLRAVGGAGIMGVLEIRTDAPAAAAAAATYRPDRPRGSDLRLLGTLSGDSIINNSSSSSSSVPMPYFRIYRIGLIRQASVALLLTAALIAVASVTRADTLGTLVMTLAGIWLLLLIYYYTATAVVHLLRFHYRVRLEEPPAWTAASARGEGPLTYARDAWVRFWMYPSGTQAIIHRGGGGGGVPQQQQQQQQQQQSNVVSPPVGDNGGDLVRAAHQAAVYRHSAMGQNVDDSPGLWHLWVLYCAILAVAASVVLTVLVFFPFLQTRSTWTSTGLYLLWVAIINIGGSGLMYMLAQYQADAVQDHIAAHQRRVYEAMQKQA